MNLLDLIRNLSEDSLAKQIYTEQIQNYWPGLGLATEAKKLCENLGINYPHSSKLYKALWSDLASILILKANSDQL